MSCVLCINVASFYYAIFCAVFITLVYRMESGDFGSPPFLGSSALESASSGRLLIGKSRFRTLVCMGQWVYVPLCIYVPIGYVVFFCQCVCVSTFMYLPFPALTPTTFRTCLGCDSEFWEEVVVFLHGNKGKLNILSSMAQEHKSNLMWRYHWFHPSNTIVHESRSMFFIVHYVLDVLGAYICSQKRYAGLKYIANWETAEQLSQGERSAERSL